MKYLIAFIISVAGVSSSYYFLKPQYQLPTNNEKKDAVAKISYTTDSGVQKMPAGQAFWVDVSNGAELYVGDSIRTNDNTSANINFIGSETKLNIQPETRFVVEKKGNKFIVGDIEGNLFVENAKAMSDVQIKAGGRTIDVSEGKAQINVSGGEVDLALKGGKVTTKVNGQEQMLSGKQSGKLTDSGFKEKKVKFLNVIPRFDQILYYDQEKKDLTFTWDKVKGNYNYSILVGKNQKQLHPLSKEEILKSSNSSIKAKVNRGTFYWKIVGRDKSDPNIIVYSDVFKFSLKNLYRPLTNLPKKNEVVKFKKDQKTKIVRFNWKSASPIENSFIEIASDSKFKNVLFSDETSNKAYSVDMAEGIYFWRVTVNYKGSKKYIKTESEQFSVKYFNSTFPPALILPRSEETILLSEKQKKTDVQLNWKRVDVAKKYRISLVTKSGKKPIIVDKDIETPNLLLTNLHPGKYQWKVASIDDQGQVSSFSKTRSFSVSRPQQIEWLNKSFNFEYIKKPEVKLGWSKTKGAKKWRIEYAPNQSFKNSISEVIEGSAVKLPIRLDGVYYIKVKALNDDDKVIAKSSIISIKVKEKPLPFIPKFRKDVPQRIIASTAGKVKLAFKPLSNIEDRVIIRITDQNGEVIRLHRMRSVQEILKGLMPGKYFISAQVEDKYERRSLPSTSKELEVPEYSYVLAPKVDNIVIK